MADPGDQWVEAGFSDLRRGQPDRALKKFGEALQLRSGNVAALVGATSALLRLGHPKESFGYAERAQLLQPQFPEVQANFAAACLATKRPGDALAATERALALRPAFFEAHFNRAEALLALHRHAEAVQAYDHALQLRPGFAPSHLGKGHAFRELGEAVAADHEYGRALQLDPSLASARVGQLLATIPIIPDEATNLEDSRRDFALRLTELEDWVAALGTVPPLSIVGIAQPFYLAYQEQSNKELLSRWGRLCSRLMKDLPVPPSPAVEIKPGNGPLRVGVVTSHMREHSVYRALIKGWIEHLPSEDVSISVFHLSSKPETAIAPAHACAEIIACADQTLTQTVTQIRRRGIEILIYPEIGMDPVTLQLASMRLARHQIASWGHPQTSGLPTIDYYISAEAFEPAEAQQHYSERLVRLPGIGCHYEPPQLMPAVNADIIGFEANVPVLLCPGTPYKYAPQHDAVLVAIARQLGPCRLVFFESPAQTLSHKLLARLHRVFQAAGLNPLEHLVMVPWQSPWAFHALMYRSDALLDTLGFSGFNTAMQAVECGLPIAAYEGQFLRGRLASGMLRQMQLHDLVASDPEQYVHLAVRLAREPGFRDQVRERMRVARSRLYGDRTPILALRNFLLSLPR